MTSLADPSRDLAAEPDRTLAPDRPALPTPADAADSADRARRLFRYLAGDEWDGYRAIMAVFAGTFFAEFTPDDVMTRLQAAGREIDPAVIGDRLESLRAWGNLTVSSSIGNPTDLADYYRRRNRYLITRAGQEVHGLVEGVLSRVDQLRDVSTGRLRSLLDALVALDATNLDTIEPDRLADLVLAVFDPHSTFTDEITQFFAAINQWQSRYDLTADEFGFFAEVLVGYVSERLEEIERLARPIGQRLAPMLTKTPTIAQRLTGGLAGRVARAGLADSIAIGHTPGSTQDDWDHLATWFVARAGGLSRIDQLGRDAVAAIRTLTLNLTRLSRVAIGASSRRADFLRLASLLHTADPDQVPDLVAAAFGLYGANHLGVLAEDALDPMPTSTSWWDAPRAPVAVSLRERGETSNKGRPSPLADRSTQQAMIRLNREHERRSRERVDAELLAFGSLDGATLSTQAMARFQQLHGRTSHRSAAGSLERQASDSGLCCIVRRQPGARTVISCPEGVLTLQDVAVQIVTATDRMAEPTGARHG